VARPIVEPEELKTMSHSADANEPEARYISVQDVEYQLGPGCTKTFRKHLLTTDRLAIHQTAIRGRGDAEDYGVCETTRALYVLSGTATLKHEDPARGDTQVGKGHLIVIPAGVSWGKQLAVCSDDFVLLEVARTATSQVARSEGTAQVHAVDPKDVEPYEPAGHAQTTNRCLFVDEHMELIEGSIARGGGAARHLHWNNEQFLYVLGGVGVPLLIYYPMGAPHGTGGGVPEPMELLVIYSPPLGESQNALA
jgi:quercetin dioxygenase-like cupin family protein